MIANPGGRAVVTGGAGFLGSHLCARLLGLGFGVICLDNFVTSSFQGIAPLMHMPGFRLINCDATDRFSVDGDLDFVFHLASPASPVDYSRLPVHTLKAGSVATLNALDLALRKQARFVLASSSEIYGDPKEHPQSETYWGNVDPTGPRSSYDEAKRFAEAAAVGYAASYQADIAIARIFNSYGPHMRPHDGRAIPTFIRQALRNEPMTVTGEGRQTRSICYVDDTIDGMLALASSAHPGPINIGSPHELTVLEIALMIRDTAGSRSPVVFIDRPPGDPAMRCPDIAQARELLGWEPRIVPAEGLKRTVDWFAGLFAGPGYSQA